jgi:hypothetical protein
MNELLALIGGVLLRATWLMGGGLLLAMLIQRRRPLIASSLLTAMLVMLLILPILVAKLPGLPIPLWSARDVQSSGIEIAASPAGAAERRHPAREEVGRTIYENAALGPDPEPRRSDSRIGDVGSMDEVSEQRAEETLGSNTRTPRQVSELDAAALSEPRGLGHWPATFVSVYLLGVLICLIRFAAGLLLIHRLRQKSVAIGGDWRKRLAGWQQRLGDSRPVELLSSDQVMVPTTVGWRKPVIILPESMEPAPESQHDAVLLHELSHIHRHDYRDLLLLQLVQALYWCHPLVWIIRLVAGPLREQACDDVCIHWMGNARAYRAALLEIARKTLARPRLSLGLAMASTSRLSRRVAQIDCSSGCDRCAPVLGVRLAVSCALLMGALFVGLVKFVPRRATAETVGKIDQPVVANNSAASADEGSPRQPATGATPVSEEVALQNGPQPPNAEPTRIDLTKLRQWLYVGDQSSARELRVAVEKGQQALLAAQQSDGSWDTAKGQYRVGTSSLALLALLKTGVPVDSPDVQRGLTWLRPQEPHMTYEISLMIQALAAAHDGDRDLKKVAELAKLLADMQLRQGPDSGSWTYANQPQGRGDRSNAQFAVMGLQAAQQMGIRVSNDTWREAQSHWLGSQKADGAWSYSGPGLEGSSSMTVGGIASLNITRTMLSGEGLKTQDDGTPACGGESQLARPLEQAGRWLGKQQSAKVVPGDVHWTTYYLCGLSRAGRFSGLRAFVDQRLQQHDWYQEGLKYLLKNQDRDSGVWKEGQQNIVVTTSFAMLFLSRGLEPVLINKLQYGSNDSDQAATGKNGNRHPNDIANLVQFLGSRPNWPREVTWQTIDVAHAKVADLRQAPVLFLTGSEVLDLTPEEVALLKSYLDRGGSLFVDSCCRSEAFDKALRNLVGQIYPPNEARLKLLPAEHPVYHSEFNLVDEQTGVPPVELWGLEIDGRTSIIYSPHGLSCLWDQWTAVEVPGRPKGLTAKVTRAVRVGTNVVSYMTRRALAAQGAGGK